MPVSPLKPRAGSVSASPFIQPTGPASHVPTTQISTGTSEKVLPTSSTAGATSQQSVTSAGDKPVLQSTRPASQIPDTQIPGTSGELLSTTSAAAVTSLQCLGSDLEQQADPTSHVNPIEEEGEVFD